MTTPRRKNRALLALLTLVLALTGELFSPAMAFASPASDEQQFIQKINQLRASKGLSTLSVHGELTREARKWSGHMAQTDVLEHTSSLATGISAHWTVLGENVGIHSGQDVNGLFDAFVASPSHYANLIDSRYHYVGVGVTYDAEGKLWTTHRFMAVHPAPGQPTTTAPPPSTTRPPTTRPPTTRPPTTRPPTTRPPTTRPPTTRPPTTRPPTTRPPTTRPPSTTKPLSQPATTKSSGTSSSSEPPGTTAPSRPPASQTSSTTPSLDAEAIAAILADLTGAGF